MQYANVSVKFPRTLDEEIEHFIEETGIYTNKSEFIKEACRRQLQDLHDDSAIAALRVEKLLTEAEQRTESDAALRERLAELRAAVDTEGADLESVVRATREETADRTFEDA